MPADLLTAAKAVLKRLGEIVSQDAELRLHLGELISSVLALAEEPERTAPSSVAAEAPTSAPAEVPASGPESCPASVPPEASTVEAAAAAGLAPTPVVAAAEVAAPPAPAARPIPEAAEPYPGVERPASVATGSWQAVDDEELAHVESRCVLKAEAAQWAGPRQRLVRDGADYYVEIAPRDNDLIARAKALPDCFLWMIHRDGPTAKDPRQYQHLAGCFRAAARAIALAREVLAADDSADMVPRALQLAAEAQSALRSAVAALGARPDPDQSRIFTWLRATAYARQLLIPRFMRADDAAEPGAWPALLEQLAEAADEMERARERVRRRGKLLGKVRHHARQIAAAAEAERPEDWRRILEVTGELLEDGLPPSNRELRELLLPIIDLLPEEPPPKHFGLVLREIDRYLASRSAQSEATDADRAAATSLSGEVRHVAELLRGRAAVLIGGQERRHAAKALSDAFELSELIWLEGSQSSYFAFEPHIARADVAVVLLAVRWSAHGFAEVKAFCDKYAKPLVRLPAGYNPNQVAHHILGQIGERLAGVQPVPC